MSTLTVLMGPPGAGKTTWVQSNLAGRVLCSTERLHDPAMRRPGALVAYLTAIRAKAQRALQGQRDVLVDACNTRASDRSAWLGLARSCGARTELVVFDTPLEVALAAQRARADPVAEAKMRSYYAEYQRALGAVRGEGWGSIEYVRRGAPASRRVSSW